MGVFFRFLYTKTLRRMNSTLYGEAEQQYQKPVFLMFFTLLGTKKHAKHPIWDKKTRFPETCLLSVYERAMHQNAIKRRKHRMGNKTT